ncbi:MAG TPA: DNA (cytosine-5-)-methyltransferase [Anaerolineales bacterium]|nr:DNA (cytosine-5-)-methyltransferase [Anaerolineales bacterium]HNS61427.1 DNA (cytosine-5-)-methyltransferase [Anaerolineales bacterium]
MPKDILVRNIPSGVRNWIDNERQQNQMSQQEFILSVLQEAQAVYQPSLFSVSSKIEGIVPDSIPFKFVDLFAGIGGFRIALTKLGGKCVFSSEWDKYSQKTYKNWFGEIPHGDVRNIEPLEIPDHDILAAGFPCQPFSLAGVSKKNSLGKAHGFQDVNQGNLFFYLATIIEIKRPPVLFLENVKNLQSHDKGKTWQVIRQTLEELGYWVNAKVIDASGWVPQHRERIYIVCFDKNVFKSEPPFKFPEPPQGEKPKLADVLDLKPDLKYTLTDHLWKYLQNYAKRHKKKGNGFGFGLAYPSGITRTLSARYYKDGSEILIPQKGKNPRRLTPQECARLMGFDDVKIVVSDMQAYKQFGNAVVPKVVEAIGNEIVKVLSWQIQSGDNCLLKK